VCCDVERAYIRIAWASDNLDLHEAVDRPVCLSEAGSDPVVESIRSFVADAGEKIQDVGVCISVPTRVAADTLRVRDIMSWAGEGQTVWESSKSRLVSELNPRAFTIVNDMVALGHTIPELHPGVIGHTKHLRALGGQAAVEGYPIVVVGVRRGLGAAGFVSRQDDRWLPVQTEGGFIGLHTSHDQEHGVLHKLRVSIHRRRRGQDGYSGDRYTLSASDVLSELGLRELVETVALHFDERRQKEAVRKDGSQVATVPFNDPNELLNLALGDGPHQAIASKAIEFWGAYFGAFLRDLALAYGALGGVFIEGDLPWRFLTHNDPCGALKAMNANFEHGGPDDEYLKAIPRILITHPNPYLKGLARIVPQTLKP
jgi:glucokinase